MSIICDPGRVRRLSSNWLLCCLTVSRPIPVWVVLAGLLVVACKESSGPTPSGIYGFANGCFALEASDPSSGEAAFLAATPTGEAFGFTAKQKESGARFTMRASDLGSYLFYDQDRTYLVAEKGRNRAMVLSRQAKLLSDILLLDDTYVSPAEWDLEVSVYDENRFQLRHRATGLYLMTRGFSADVSDAAVITFYPQSGCASFPELSIDADGSVERRTSEDGSVFGFAEPHSHMFTNFGFGGGGIFHGAPFHRLGVEHALGSCEPYHGVDGRKDLVGFFMREDGVVLDTETVISMILKGETPDFNHRTDGYPYFSDWPNARASLTHQTMYYRWVERAYLAGMRLLVQHATSNSVLCDMVVSLGVQKVRYSCNDMVSIDRIIEETYKLERYIDAQLGGPGRGWFRIVKTPAEARRVINDGKLAVILGIEISNLFDCFLTPHAGVPACDAERVREQLDHYLSKGIRVLFPVHKFDNAFSPGDGHAGIIELGNFINSGHFTNEVEDCPDVPTVFDRGDVVFGGLNKPRDEYLAPAPVDMSGFSANPVAALLPFLGAIQAPKIAGNFCQKAGITALGETLLKEMMKRGIVVELDHLPRRAYARAFELLQQYNYPAAGTHGNTNGGKIFQLGGFSMFSFDRCADPDQPGAMGASMKSVVAQSIENGGYPAVSVSFDFNGFAGAPLPRFGENSRCTKPQSNPITYPFRSYAGDVNFTKPHLGERTVDFNTEGMIHFGLLPELIEDARRNGVTDEDLKPLFQSAEAYIRTWERSLSRAAELVRQGDL